MDCVNNNNIDNIPRFTSTASVHSCEGYLLFHDK